MNIVELKNWATEYKLEERTKTSFFKMLENYKLDNPEEYQNVFGNIKMDELSLQIHTVSLNLGNWPECSYNTVSSSMWIHYKERQIASYKALFSLNGEAEDDFFDIC